MKTDFLATYCRKCVQSFTELQVVLQPLTFSDAPNMNAVFLFKWLRCVCGHSHTQSVEENQAKGQINRRCDGLVQQDDRGNFVWENLSFIGGYCFLGTLKCLI